MNTCPPPPSLLFPPPTTAAASRKDTVASELLLKNRSALLLLFQEISQLSQLASCIWQFFPCFNVHTGVAKEHFEQSQGPLPVLL